MLASTVRPAAVFHVTRTSRSSLPMVHAAPTESLRIPKTSGGAHGCGIPNTSGLNGINVIDCQQFPQGTTAVEMTLAVTNATKVLFLPNPNPNLPLLFVPPAS